MSSAESDDDSGDSRSSGFLTSPSSPGEPFSGLGPGTVRTNPTPIEGLVPSFAPPPGGHFKLEPTLKLPFGLKSVTAQLVVRLCAAIVKRLNPSVSKATLISKSA